MPFSFLFSQCPESRPSSEKNPLSGKPLRCEARWIFLAASCDEPSRWGVSFPPIYVRSLTLQQGRADFARDQFSRYSDNFSSFFLCRLFQHLQSQLEIRRP
jgi:hypothetical protein